MRAWDIFCADFQVCMLGGTRDKWTRIVRNFPGLLALNIACDRRHTHEPWGFARDADGKQIWATSLESRYPKKMCMALVTIALEFLETRGLTLKANSLEDALNPLQVHQQSQMSVGLQPRPARIPASGCGYMFRWCFLCKNSGGHTMLSPVKVATRC